MTRHPAPATATFIGAAGNKLVADVFGDSGSPVLLLHGGGQITLLRYEQLGCILRRHPNFEASSSARQRRLGKDRRLSVQTSFSALHEPTQQSSIWSGISSIRQKPSCITRT